ncbi:MAG TPA: NUDIX domain-containing protein [Streptosporangiaceae bacterium]|jgi:8-oxo-dGTP pyrophosphatase MutT (NUDIX family)|nr:NUDIX domain-containing protein [Streptosporangiaceae bacterium]
MASRDGNGWVRCSLGHRHWGKFGAAGLLAYAGEPDKTLILLQRRVSWSHHGGTWGLPGGAADSHETPVEAALREAAEECGVPPDAVAVHGIYVDDHGGWAYQTVFARAAEPFAAYPASEETDDVEWVPVQQVEELELHPGLAAHWAELREGLVPLTVIVDAANVVGSRPDGWWRDRAGAARRLVSGVTALAGSGVTVVPSGLGLPSPARWLPDYVVVLEGQARAAVPEGSGLDGAGRVRVVGAPGSGDDTIAELAGAVPGRRLVVTADRELRGRCEQAGAQVTGPRWLTERLADFDD